MTRALKRQGEEGSSDMRRPLVPLISLTFFSTTSLAAVHASFTSNKGFTVEYPSSWVRLRGNPNELDIMSTHHRVEGVVIPNGGAEIIVREIALKSNQDLAGFVRKNYDVDVISQKRVSIRPGKRSNCDVLERVEATFEIAPDPHGVQRQTFFLCRIGHRSFLTFLTRWEGDRVNPKWEETVDRVANSVEPTRSMGRHP